MSKTRVDLKFIDPNISIPMFYVQISDSSSGKLKKTSEYHIKIWLIRKTSESALSTSEQDKTLENPVKLKTIPNGM
jgi:hypothetical protein